MCYGNNCTFRNIVFRVVPVNMQCLSSGQLSSALRCRTISAKREVFLTNTDVRIRMPVSYNKESEYLTLTETHDQLIRSLNSVPDSTKFHNA